MKGEPVKILRSPLHTEPLLGICQNPLEAACSFLSMHDGRSPYRDRYAGGRFSSTSRKSIPAPSSPCSCPSKARQLS